MNIPCNEVITSNNVLIKDNNHSTSSVRNPGRKRLIPGKEYPDPDRPKIKFPDPDRPEIKCPNPTRPENILKNVPRPWTGFGPVRSGETQGFGILRRSLLWCISITQKEVYWNMNNNKKWNNDCTNLLKAAIANTSLCDVADKLFC